MKIIMNLNVYDNIIEKLDKTKTWVDVRRKTLLSRELANRPYTCLMKRYNIKTNICSYYIAMLDNPPEDRKYKSTTRDDYGRVKVNLSQIWNETYLARLGSNCNVMLNLIEHDDDGDIYLLDV